MEETILSMNDMLERYKKMDFKSKNFHGNTLDKFLSTVFNGIECDKYFFRTNDSPSLNNGYFEKRYEPFIENGDQLACLDRDNITIRSRDKRLMISTNEYRDYAYNEVLRMYHSTEEGLYYFNLQAVCHANKEVKRYEFNLMHYPLLKGGTKMNVGVEQPICFVVPEYTVAKYNPIEIKEEDIPNLTNKLFKEGLSVFCEKVRNKQKFEFTKEDVEYSQDLSDDTIEEKKTIQEFVEEPIEKEENKELDINQVINVLVYLNEKGIELSEEQKNMIYLYKDINGVDHNELIDNIEEENSKSR